MPKKDSNQKRHRQSLKRRQYNRSWKKRINTLRKDFLESLQARDIPAASVKLQRLMKAFHRAAARGVIHPRNAARRISRLSRHLSVLKRESLGSASPQE